MLEQSEISAPENRVVPTEIHDVPIEEVPEIRTQHQLSNYHGISEAHSLNRLVYKLVRVGDDGTVLPTAEEDDMQVECFVERDTMTDAPAQGSMIGVKKENLELDDEKEDAPYMGPTDIEAERTKLLARLKVLDEILLKVKTTEDEVPTEHAADENVADSNPLPRVEKENRVYKRRRRSNYKCGSTGPENRDGKALQVVDVKLGVEFRHLETTSAARDEPLTGTLEEKTAFNTDTAQLENSEDHEHVFSLEESEQRQLSSDTMVTDAKALDSEEIVEPSSLEQHQDGHDDPERYRNLPSTVLGDAYFSLSATQKLEGKRKRKPNRRYIEDETDNLYFVSNVHRLISDGNDSYDGPKSRQHATEKADSGSDVDYPEFESPTQATVPHGRRSIVKRKAERKAVRLARLSWSSRKRVSKGAVRKEKSESSPEKENCFDVERSMDQMIPEYGDVGGEDSDLDFSTEHVETVPTPNGGTRRKHHRPWTLREVMILVEGVARCGGGKWADIKKLEFSSVTYRTAVDLKDKWRNLLRASRVHFTSKQTEHRKKHFAVSIPQPILARVRELAALQNHQTSMPVVTRTSRSGRTLRRR